MNRLLKLALIGAGLAAALPFATAAETNAAAAPAAGAPAGAFPHHEHPARRQRRVAFHRLARRLNLSPAQIGQARAIRASTHAAIAAIRANASLTKDQKRAQIHGLRVATRHQMDAVLTPVQQARLNRLREHMAERLGGF
jgi:Spy/CpxP family protein refolding chaperone